MGYLYFNFQYLLFMLPAVALSFIDQIMVKSTFNRYSRVMTRRGMTGAMAAEQVLWANHVPGIQFRPLTRPATLCSMSRAIGPSGCAAPWCR